VSKPDESARAPKAGEMIPVWLHLAPRDYERLMAQAEKRGLDDSSTVRMVVMEWLAEQERGGTSKAPIDRAVPVITNNAGIVYRGDTSAEADS
jgi:hypothetical protein